MKRIIKNIFSAILLAGTWMSAEAHDVETLGMTGLDLDMLQGKEARLSMTVNPRSLGVSSESEMKITPVLKSADGKSEYRFPAMIVAGRNRMMRYRRGQRRLAEGYLLWPSSENYKNYHDRTAAYYPWMDQSTLIMEVEVNGCCGKKKSATELTVAEIDLTPEEFSIPQGFRLKAPAKADPKIIELKGSAFVDFRVNRTEIDPAYRNNVAELTKILNTVEVARQNPDATITSISIKGFASPEGSYSNNVRLAKGRTQSLKDYIRNRYGFEEKLFQTSFEPEDWEGLREYVDTCRLASRQGLLDIINSDMEPDAKDAALKRSYPGDYDVLLKEVYPGLRHSDYVVQYRIKQYTTVDDIRRVLRERPSNLSESELLMLLGACEPGGHEFNDVVEAGVKLFPANAQLQYLYGVALTQKHDYVGAREWFAKSSEAGVVEAAEALEQIDRILNPAPSVRYVNK